MNQVFSLTRMRSLLTYKFYLNYKTWGMQLLAFTGIFILVTSLMAFVMPAEAINVLFEVFFILTIFACGLYISSRSYADLKNTGKGFLFMQLPVSVFEKFIVPAFFGGIIFPLLFAMFYSLVSHLSSMFIQFMYGIRVNPMSLFSDLQIVAIKLFIAVQSFFLIGSLHFKKQHLLWTSLTILTIVALFLAVWIPVSRLAFGSFQSNVNWVNLNINVTARGFTSTDLKLILFTSFGWLISYFKLKEKEV